MPRDPSAVQSLTRGLTVLRLLAANGDMTATAIARVLGLDQSSASRLLRSLQEEGFVCKPSFHSFALDLGVLLFAGTAMSRFEEVGRAAMVASRLAQQSSVSVACTMLREGRLLYLAHVGPGVSGPMRLVDDSDFPIHRSSPGLLLAHRLGQTAFLRIMRDSLARHRSPCDHYTPDDLWRIAGKALGTDGVLFLRRFGPNAFSASQVYATKRGDAALTLFSQDKVMARAAAAALLAKGVRELTDAKEQA